MLKIKENVKTFNKMSYVKGDDGGEMKGGKLIDCALGTNPFGYSDEVLKYNESFDMKKLNYYPEFPYMDLRRDIAGFWSDAGGITCDNIRIGSGSMGVMVTFNKVFIEDGTRVLGYCPQFTEYMSEVRSLGGEYDYVSLRWEDGLKFNCEELMEKMDESYSAVYIDNPNNPTGQIIPLDEIVSIAERARDLGICLVVDEAYGDFMGKENSAVNIVPHYDNVFVARSFSKGMGLAGLRIGYGVCSGELLEFYRKMDSPFSLTSIAHDIARIALKDEVFIRSSIEKVRESKRRLVENLDSLKVSVTDASVPIMVIMHPDRNVDLHRLFCSKGVLTESGEDFIGLGRNFVRLRIPVDMEELLHVVKEIELDIRKSA